MVKKTIEIELPDVDDKMLLYLVIGVLLLSQISTAYLTLQVNENIKVLSEAVRGLVA